MLDPLFSRGGLSGLAGWPGLAAGLTSLRVYRVPLVRGAAAAGPGLALGHAIGRVGCFRGRRLRPPEHATVGRRVPKAAADRRAGAPDAVSENRRAGRPGVVVAAIAPARRCQSCVATIRFGIEFVRINAPVLDL
jgi:phosphatidylglycerol:prolipoprotein diacylglycerol transferase